MNPNILIPHQRSSFIANRKTEALQMHLSMKQIHSLCILLLMILGVYYVWTLNTNATQGYEFRKLETLGRQLELQKNLLGVTLAEFESLNKLSRDLDERKMESVESPEYLITRDSEQTSQ